MADFSEFAMTPIGWMRCDYASRYETPRQPSLAGDNRGVIELVSGANFEQALVGLAGFSHLWVVYVFHRNEAPTRPRVMIQPPRYKGGKVGVFATRSPHRPNPIGLSCVQLERIEGRFLHVRGLDLLDGTPVLDIKPYIAAYDSHPHATKGWLEERELEKVADEGFFDVELTPHAQAQCDWIAQRTGIRLDRYAQVQLQESPLDTSRKRIEQRGDGDGLLHYRTWRIAYQVNVHQRAVSVTSIASARPNRAADPYDTAGPHEMSQFAESFAANEANGGDGANGAGGAGWQIDDASLHHDFVLCFGPWGCE